MKITAINCNTCPFMSGLNIEQCYEVYCWASEKDLNLNKHCLSFNEPPPPDCPLRSNPITIVLSTHNSGTL